MSDELYNDYRSDDDQDSTSSEEDAAGGSQRRQPKRKEADGYEIGDMLPSSKRAMLRKKYGNLDGKFLEFDGNGDDGNGGGKKAAAADSDSDLEILRETAAAEEVKAQLARRAAATAAGANPTRPGSAQAEDWQNRQLLARARAHMQQENAPEEEDDDEIEEIAKYESPVPRRRGAAAVAAAEAVREPSATPSDPSTVKRKNVIIIRFKDKQDHEKRIKVKKSNTLEKAMNAFRQEAEAQGWVAPGGGAGCRFIFEGDPLRPDATPAGLDMEDDEVIEVHYA